MQEIGQGFCARKPLNAPIRCVLRRLLAHNALRNVFHARCLFMCGCDRSALAAALDLVRRRIQVKDRGLSVGMKAMTAWAAGVYLASGFGSRTHRCELAGDAWCRLCDANSPLQAAVHRARHTYPARLSRLPMEVPLVAGKWQVLRINEMRLLQVAALR